MTERQRLFVARPVPVAMHGKCQRIEFIGVDFSTLRPRGTLEAPAASPWAQFHSYTFGIRYAALSFSTGALGHDNDDPALRYGPNRLFFSLLREFFPPLKSLASPRVRAVLIDVTFPSKQQKRGLCFSGRVFYSFKRRPGFLRTRCEQTEPISVRDKARINAMLTTKVANDCRGCARIAAHDYRTAMSENCSVYLRFGTPFELRRDGSVAD